MDVVKTEWCVIIFVLCVEISSSQWSAGGRVGIRFYTKGPSAYIESPLESGVRIFKNEHYNSSLSLVILIHGMDASVNCEFVEGTVKAMFYKGVNKGFNIFALNLPELMASQSMLDKYLYTTAINSKIAGKAIGEFLNDMIKQQLTSPNKIYLIGYSMGAQVAGYTAREIKKTHGEIHFIMGLDPAGIGFTPSTIAAWYTGLTHVSAADAKYVHFMHCNSVGWGTLHYNATANFIFNGGYFQPGCSSSKNFGCSHNRVPFYLIEGIIYPENFISRKCNSWNRFLSCLCLKKETRLVTFPPDLSSRGDYYLRTNAVAPFGRGETGINCSQENMIIIKLDDYVRKQNIQARTKYKKKRSKIVHYSETTSITGYPHRSIGDYERMHNKISTRTNHKNNNILEHKIKPNQQTIENDIPINGFLENMHHHSVNK